MGQQEKERGALSKALGKATGITAAKPLPDPNLLERAITWLSDRVSAGEPSAQQSGGENGEGVSSARLVDGDIPYLRQFTQPRINVLPAQALRPTRNTRIPSIPFRTTYAPDVFDAELYNDPEEAWGPADMGKLSPQDEYQQQALRQALDGLGSRVMTKGKDTQGDYLSVYDEWDFKSPSIKPLFGKVLDTVGQPFGVYDRFDIQSQRPNPDKNRADFPIVTVKRRK